MIAILNAQLTLSPLPSSDPVDVTVNYDVRFDQIDRYFASLGVSYRERITVIGIDPPGSFAGSSLGTRVYASPGWTSGSGQQVHHRIRHFQMARTSLNEDTGFLNHDEIRCRIEVYPVNPPTMPTNVVSQYTNQETLVELGFIAP